MAANTYYNDQAYSAPNQEYTNANAQGQPPYHGYSQASDMNQSHDRTNPYGCPESNTAQPYYGHNDPSQHPAQNHQYTAHGYDQNQHYGGYDSSYNADQQPSYAQYPSDSAYPATNQYNTGNYAPPQHDQYQQYQPNSYQDPHAYDSTRQGYQYDAHSQIPPDPAIAAAKVDPNGPPLAEGERGLMGALAGGALGAYGGHQMGHGIIGGIGGAIAGSKLEDHCKDKKKEKKHRKHRSHDEHRRERRGSRSSSSSSSSSSDSDSDGGKKKRKHRKHRNDRYGAAGLAGGYAASHRSRSRDGGYSRGGYAGNFSASSSNITLDRDYDLIALCSANGGKEKLSSIDLNDYLTNEWGKFKWARGGNAFASAKNVRLIDSGRVLEAELGDGRGGSNLSRIALDERISNEDGNLVYLG